MQFSGYWVANAEGRISVTRDTFDETELSDQSNWTEAWQNEDPALPHGFIDPLAMLHLVCALITGNGETETPLGQGDVTAITTLEDLARLIQATIPKPDTISAATFAGAGPA